MKIYTHTGDSGITEMLCLGRLPKYDVRVEAVGTVDELNSWIGYIRSINDDEAVEEKLDRLQSRMQTLCSDVAAPLGIDKRCEKVPRVLPGWVADLEDEIDQMQKDLPELTTFISPVGTATSAALHLARTVCRRGERWLVLISEKQGGVNAEAIRFINRLSDHLFTLGRWADFRGWEKDNRLKKKGNDRLNRIIG